MSGKIRNIEEVLLYQEKRRVVAKKKNNARESKYFEVFLFFVFVIFLIESLVYCSIDLSHSQSILKNSSINVTKG